MNIGVLRTMDISSSGLRSERMRLQAASENIANRDTTRTEDGSYYKTKEIVSRYVKKKPVEANLRLQPLRRSNGQIVELSPLRKDRKYLPGTVDSRIGERNDPPVRIYDPEHPDAGEDGYVSYPDIDLAKQMAEAITAIRSYEANVTALNSAKYIIRKSIEI